ncbi:hypothetical protein GEV33_011291 [Tenebrio molitor]|uniref:ENTH domain-containing protein n=1 Tax=Tenebrio molitor TaxID=7067 RepID=A0A8J6HBB1_TENMO|nr:hypothetical protein GEV33_011291 [Tenebrio molitor]
MTARMAGQTINDRLLAAKHSLAGQGLAKSVCKATTEEMIGPKKKHLDFEGPINLVAADPPPPGPHHRRINREQVLAYCILFNEARIACCTESVVTKADPPIVEKMRIRRPSALLLIRESRKIYSFGDVTLDECIIQDYVGICNRHGCSSVWITGGEKPSKKLFRLEPTRTSFECGLETLQDFTRIDMLLNREANIGVKLLVNDNFHRDPDSLASDTSSGAKFCQTECSSVYRESETLKVQIPTSANDLLHCTNEPNVSIPQLANLLVERSQNTNWVVVYKALITVHHMMCYGNERFTQYLASSNSTFQLSSFLDKSGVQDVFRKEDGMLRTMNADKLLKTLPVLQNQLDALLEFDCSANDLTNGVINMCFMLLFKDLIRLFACYNDDGIRCLLAEKFFDMNKKQCKEALDIYKKFLIRMDKVAEFLKVAENVGIDKGDIPDLTKAPSSLLDALEQHLNHMEGKKSSQTSSSQSTSNQKNVKSGVSALSSTSNAFGNVVANGRFDTPANGIDETLKLQALAEEEAAMNQFKSKVNSPPSSVNPFLSNSSSSSSKTASASEIDLFASEPIAPAAPRASDDLLQLSNPFADAFAQPQPVNTGPFMQPNNIWMANGNAFVAQPPSPVVSNGAFVSENNFASVFGAAESKIDDPDPPLLLDIGSPDPNPIQHVLSYFQKDSNFSEMNLQNSGQHSDVAKVDDKAGPNFQDGALKGKNTGFDALGGVLQPVSAGQTTTTSANNINNNNNINNANNNTLNQQASPLLTGDLESSLASLAENLTINSRTAPIKGVQWNSPKNGSKTNNWTPQPMSATTGAGYKPMNQSMSSPPLSMQTTLQPQMYPQLPPMMGMRPIVASPAMIPQMSPLGVVPNPSSQMGQQSLLFH